MRKVVDGKKRVVDLLVDNVIEKMRRQVTGIGLIELIEILIAFFGVQPNGRLGSPNYLSLTKFAANKTS